MASNSVPQSFGGMACPLNISFGRSHGPNAVVAYMTVDGVLNAPLGTGIWMQVGSAMFIGFISKLESNGDTTTIRAVDWRDRLQDVYFYGAYNMQESDGRFYHIPDLNWLTQIRVWVSREFIQQDFDDVQDLDPTDTMMISILGQRLVSVLTLMHYFARKFDFILTLEQNAYNVASRSYPFNLDWNSGVRRGDMIQQLLEKCGLQFTCYGFKNLHVTMRGFTDDAFAQQFLAGLASYCNIGASAGSIGVEFNEKGRRATILGDKNKYEMVFPCKQNWNPAWTWELCFNGYALSALLEKHTLTRLNRLGELPKEYHDTQTWDNNDFAGKGNIGERKTRNEMTIRDYIEKVCFHCYIADFTNAARQFERTETDFSGIYTRLDDTGLQPLVGAGAIGAGGGYVEFPLENYSLEINWDNPEYHSLWPLSPKLNTDSNLQFLVYATSNKLIRGLEHPFEEQKVFVPKDQGVSIAIEEVMRPQKSRAVYAVRVWFNAPQYWADPDKPHDDPKSITPDRVLVRLTLEAEFFARGYGEAANGPRVREQKVSVRNLYRAFVLNDDPTDAVEEVTVLRQNFIKNLEDGGVFPVANPVRADDIAFGIAKQVLNHPFMLRSGNLTFEGRAGVMVDGVIESTAITFNDQGITEVVNLTTESLDDRDLNSPTVIRVSRVEKTEDDLVKDRQLTIGLAAMREADMAKKAMAVLDAGLHLLGSLLSPAEVMTAFGRESKVEVKMPKDVVEDHTHEVGELLIIGKKK